MVVVKRFLVEITSLDPIAHDKITEIVEKEFTRCSVTVSEVTRLG